MKSKRPRNTPNRLIATAPTRAQKWKTALTISEPSPVQYLPFNARILRSPSAHGKQWDADAKETLKQQFADVLFPALWNNDTQPFEELITAMCDCRRFNGNLPDYMLARCGKKKLSKRQESGRLLRLALLSLEPEDRLTTQTVLDALSKSGIEPADQSHLKKVMREIDVRLLIPGQKCQWRIGERKGRLIRELVVNRDGTLTNRGMTREQACAAASWRHYIELIPTS